MTKIARYSDPDRMPDGVPIHDIEIEIPLLNGLILSYLSVDYDDAYHWYLSCRDVDPNFVARKIDAATATAFLLALHQDILKIFYLCEEPEDES